MKGYLFWLTFEHGGLPTGPATLSLSLSLLIQDFESYLGLSRLEIRPGSSTKCRLRFLFNLLKDGGCCCVRTALIASAKLLVTQCDLSVARCRWGKRVRTRGNFVVRLYTAVYYQEEWNWSCCVFLWYLQLEQKKTTSLNNTKVVYPAKQTTIQLSPLIVFPLFSHCWCHFCKNSISYLWLLSKAKKKTTVKIPIWPGNSDDRAE